MAGMKESWRSSVSAVKLPPAARTQKAWWHLQCCSKVPWTRKGDAESRGGIFIAMSKFVAKVVHGFARVPQELPAQLQGVRVDLPLPSAATPAGDSASCTLEMCEESSFDGYPAKATPASQRNDTTGSRPCIGAGCGLNTFAPCAPDEASPRPMPADLQGSPEAVRQAL